MPGLDPESSPQGRRFERYWIPASAGMTTVMFVRRQMAGQPLDSGSFRQAGKA